MNRKYTRDMFISAIIETLETVSKGALYTMGGVLFLLIAGILKL